MGYPRNRKDWQRVGINTYCRAIALWRRTEFWVLATLLLIAGALWAFVEIADEVVEGEAYAVDRRILAMFRSAEDPGELIGPFWVEEMARDITALGGFTVLFLIILMAAGYLLLVRKWRLMLLLLAATITGQALSSLLKLVFDRERPDIVPHLADVQTASFPSGHAMLSAVVYLTLGTLLMRAVPRMRERTFVFTCAVVLTVLVGVSRVFLGVHYPTDVLAGWAGGMAWALAWWLLVVRLQRKRTIEPPAAGAEEKGTENQSGRAAAA